MAFQRVPDTLKCTFKASRGAPYPGDYPILSSVYVRNTVVVRNTTYFQQVCDSLHAWWVAYVRPLVPASINLHAVTYQDLNAEFGEVGEDTVAPSSGSNAGEISCGFASVLFNLQCSSGAQPRRGRLYIAPPVESHVDAGGDALTVAAVTSWQTALNSLEAAATPQLADAWVVPSRFQGGAPRAEAVTNTVASWTVNGLLASQTRRRRLR